MKKFIKRNTSPWAFSLVASVYYTVHPRKRKKFITPKRGALLVREEDNWYYTCQSSRSPSRGSRQKRKFKFNRYTHKNFCSVEEGDIVLDIGAFVGEFSMPAAKKAKSVTAVEPDPDAFSALAQNTQHYKNISPVNGVVSDASRKTEFMSAKDSTESSAVNVDSGKYDRIEVDGYTVDSLYDKMIKKKEDKQIVDFAKIDAEGAEPEVLAGIDSVTVRKLAIDVGEERRGRKTKKEVDQILKSQGYETKVREDINGDPILFATLT